MRAITEMQRMPIVYNSNDDIEKLRIRMSDIRKHYFQRNRETDSLVFSKLSTPFKEIRENM